MSAIVTNDDGRKAAKSRRLAPTNGMRTPHAPEIAVHDAAATPTEQVDGDEENCPVIRANQIFFTGGASGRLRVVFY